VSSTRDQEFISRKEDHIRHSLADPSEAKESGTFNHWALIHDSLPDLDLKQISLKSPVLGTLQPTPFYIAGMTAGHPDAMTINERLARAAAARGWCFGLGSQRRELDQTYQDPSVAKIRNENPALPVISNLGISQLIELNRMQEMNRLTDLLARSGANALAIHLNPLQEAIQQEGTPNFKGGLDAIEALLRGVKVPVILKETGSGMSLSFLKRISDLPIHAVDVSGLGGTHWGRIEGMRAQAGSFSRKYGETFANWGTQTLESILNAKKALVKKPITIWASGGVRTGLDAAKCLALGASAVGFARPALQAALESEKALHQWMESVEGELQIALFCTNSSKVQDLDETKIERSRSHE
jgi:isopentenyl-diphosphate delta-isomerase